MDNKNMQIRLLMLITTPKKAAAASDYFKKCALPIQYKFNAEGTASSEIMDMLGLGSIEKKVLLSVMPKQTADLMLKKLHSELNMDDVNSGIAFTLPLTGANNIVLRIMSQIDVEAEIEDVIDKDGNNMSDSKYLLIAAVVNRGFGGNVMVTAREAGARGGTIVHSLNISNEEAEGFWGLSMQEEKEILLILADSDNKMKIMSAISENWGMHSEAKGIILSLPIDSVM